MAETLSDVFLRRTMAGYGPDVALDVADAAAEVAVKHLGWDRERAELEVRQYHEWIERYTPKGSASANRRGSRVGFVKGRA